MTWSCFSGPPGTGKTMVAGLLARELDLELYQVDLSKIVSKWVGETEKQLARVFEAAEAGHALLLFDEADALFAKRSATSSRPSIATRTSRSTTCSSASRASAAWSS
jgi:SpoVK/Ycf46/Vps4 family AAA+-type ATPase